MEKEQL